MVLPDDNLPSCASLFYSDPILDEAANVWGDKFRQILQEASGMRKNKVYVLHITLPLVPYEFILSIQLINSCVI